MKNIEKMKKDKEADKKAGIKEGSKADEKQDKKMMTPKQRRIMGKY